MSHIIPLSYEERIKPVETHVKEAKRHDNIVSHLYQVALAMRTGDKEIAFETFGKTIPEGVAGEVFGYLWKVKKCPPGHPDYGRVSFYDADPKFVSHAYEKAEALELEMLNQVFKTYQNGQRDTASALYSTLPPRFQEKIIEIARNNPHYSSMDPSVRTDSLFSAVKIHEDAQLQFWTHSNGNDQLSVLQKDLSETNKQLVRERDELHKTQQLAIDLFSALPGKNAESPREGHHAILHPTIDSTPDFFCGSLIVDDTAVVVERTAMQRFSDYLVRHCPNVGSEEEILKLIEQGQALVNKIQSGKEVPEVPDHHERAECLVQVVWYMMYCAIIKKQGFAQGTFVVLDPGEKLVNFFINCDRTYARSSTHFKERIKETLFDNEIKQRTYGIDVEGLPGGMQTVNFAPIEMLDGKDWSFFKPENWGLGDLYQLIGHSFDYLITRPAHILGRDPSGPEDRKEHISPEIKAQFQEIYRLTTKETKCPDTVKKFGIAGMMSILEAIVIDQTLDEDFKKKANIFIQELNEQYDYLHVRNGHEAILGNSFIGDTTGIPIVGGHLL